MIDNCCSISVTKNATDFIDNPSCIKSSIKGIVGQMDVTLHGTIHWYIEDDKGYVHTILLRNTLFSKQVPHCLLLPQHWAQANSNIDTILDGTCTNAYYDHIILHLKDHTIHRTIPLDPKTNIAIVYLVPRFYSYCLYSATFESKTAQQDKCEHICNKLKIASESSRGKLYHPPLCPVDTFQQKLDTLPDPPGDDEIIPINFSKTDPTSIPKIEQIEEEEVMQMFSPQSKLPRWHYCLGHLSFKTLQYMAKHKILHHILLSSLATKVADSIQIGHFGLLQMDDPDSDGYYVLVKWTSQSYTL